MDVYWWDISIRYVGCKSHQYTNCISPANITHNMSRLVPISSRFRDMLYDDFDRPSRMFDQHFGNTLSLADEEDFFRRAVARNRLESALPSRYDQALDLYRPRRLNTQLSRESGMSEITSTQEKFAVNLDVPQFKPEELTVKVSDNILTIEAKHEEKEDDHGYIARHFVRKYTIPSHIDAEKLASNLSADGVLSIEAPKKATAVAAGKSIPVTHK